MKNILYISAVLLLLTACVKTPVVVGEVSPPIDSDSVQIFYPERPGCNFETIAHLRIEGGVYSLSSLFKVMRTQAAEIGATGVYVLFAQELDIKEYVGSAKAIRCLSE